MTIEDLDHPTYNVRIYPFDDDRAEISVYRPRTLATRSSLAEINWPSIGSVSPEKARQFGEAILKAVKIAEQMNTTIK